ncbi:hypothetical protein [Candidatus Methanoperedens nitratireducens]
MAIIIHRIVDGKVTEGWECYDQHGMLKQLGVVRPPEQQE